MKKVHFRFLLGVLLTFVSLTHAAINPPARDREPFTAKELQQGYREHSILARPHAERRAASQTHAADHRVRVRERFTRLRDLQVLELDGSEVVAAVVERLRASGDYEFVEPDVIREIAREPNDPSFVDGSLWALKNTDIGGADIDAVTAWDTVREATNVIVAVIDTGLNLNHEDIIPNLWTNPSPTFGDVHGAAFINGTRSGTPSDDNGHGTHVAGTIGAVGNNGLATTGVAWRVQIMAVKVFRANGTASMSDIVRGINYAVEHGAHIINASYGALGRIGFSQAEYDALDAARSAGVIVVAAAGNSAANMDVSRFYPASHALDNIVTVGNSTRRDELSLSSNYGSVVDLFAPGSEIVSLSHSGTTGVATLSGTSMAAPHVSGALALLKAQYPTDNYRELINRLLRGVDSGERFVGKSQTGGRLNVARALTQTGTQPFNDNFAQRPRLTGDNLALRSSNAGATAEPGEPLHAGFTPRATLWWEWTAATTGTVTVNTTGSEYNTVLAVYSSNSASPNSLAELTAVAANDDNPSGNTVTSSLTFTAQAGVTYQIAVDGKPSQAGLTMLNLGTTPINDTFASPIAIEGQSLRVDGSNMNCGREPGEPTILGWQGGASVWYRWTAPRTGRFQIAVVSDDFDPLLGIFTGEAVNALKYIAESDNSGHGNAQPGSLCSLDAVAGTTYSILVDTKYASITGQFTLTITDSLWQAPTGGAVVASPAIGSDGTIYLGSTNGLIYAFGPDGSQKWTYTTNGLIDTCSPAIGDDGTVYIGSNDGRFRALTATGQFKWWQHFNNAGTVSNSPALGADGTIYVKHGDGYLYALNPSDGSIKWRFNVHAPQSYASPSLATDGTIYQGADDGKLYAINPNGTQKWVFTHPESSDIYVAPAIDAAGNVYFSVLNTGKLFSVTPDGALRWIYRDASLGSSSSAALSPDGGTVYYGGYDGKLHAVNTANGARRWIYTLGDEVRASSPAVDANGVVYIGSYDFKIHAVNPDGTLKRTWDTGNWVRSSPVIHGNRLYVGSNDTKLYAIDIGAPVASGPWPQYRQNVRRLGRTLIDPVVITAQPQTQTVTFGDALSLSVTVSGSGPFTYQWNKDGVVIPGATGATYSVPAVTADTAGSYIVVVTGPQGSVTSEPALVTVQPLTPAASRLINVSVRTLAGTDAQTLTVGFFVSGATETPLLIRGIGPTLHQFDVTGALEDPRMRLLSNGSEIANNNDWGGTPALTGTFDRVGAFSLPAGSRDAALLHDAPAGSYTVEVSGVGGTTGIALAEVYDATAADTPAATRGRLINLSARAQVGTGGDILIAGFGISEGAPKKLLIRGVGPTLAQDYGVDGALQDPVLAVYRETTKLHENNDWGGSAELAATFSSVGAFPLASASSRDAALVVTLEPGASYTAQVSGVDATTGVALIEIYEIE